MVEFKEGMAVIVIGEFNEIKKGTIKDLYASLGYAVVDFGNDVLQKVPFNEIGILPKTEAVEAEQPEEPKEEATEKEVIVKEEITITQEDFLKSCAKVCARLHIEQGAGLAFMCSDFSALLVAELFIESPEK